MTVVIGIDPSLQSTGLAALYDDGRVVVNSFGSKGKRDETLAERAARINQTTAWVRVLLADTEFAGIAFVVIEGPAGATPGGSTWDRAGLWWSLVRTALPLAPVAMVAPTTRAKWATGDGRADKAAVGASMARRAPSVTITNSDEADALALAWMGAQHLGWQPASNAERVSLKVVRWPELISD